MNCGILVVQIIKMNTKFDQAYLDIEIPLIGFIDLFLNSDLTKK